MLAKIRDILIIVNKGQLNQFKNNTNGNDLGIKISFIEQDKPRECFYFRRKIYQQKKYCNDIGR